MTERAPVDEVAAVEEGDAGEILEGGSDEVIVVAGAADGRIGSETGEDGVAESARCCISVGCTVFDLGHWCSLLQCVWLVEGLSCVH